MQNRPARPFSNPHFKPAQVKSQIQNQPDNQRQTPSQSSDIFVLTCLGLMALLILSLIPQAEIALSAPILTAFLIAVLIYRTVKYRKAAEQIEARNVNMPANQDLYVSAAQMIDLMPLAAALIDKRNRVSHANPRAQNLIGIQNTNRPLTHYIRDPDLTSHLARALSGHQPEPFTTRIDTPSERYIRLLFSKAQPLEDGSSQSLTLVIFDDVTNIELGQKLRADFLANASHELKTPIASLMGYIETLQTHAKDDVKAREKFLGIMYNQAERMQRLINDLLSLRRIEQIEHIAPSETADLYLAARFRGKQDEAVQMCLNIISNAVKLSPRGSAVHIRLEGLEHWEASRAFEASQLGRGAHRRQIITAPPAKQPCLRLTISDNGPGFAREHMPRIGERFYRVAGDLSSQEKGTGLGLAIVKHIVKRHRGGLYLASQEGQGTEFSIILAQPEPDEA